MDVLLSEGLVCVLPSDHVELLTQVRASDPHSESWGRTAHDHQPLLPRDPVHRSDRLSERGGERPGGHVPPGRSQRMRTSCVLVYFRLKSYAFSNNLL